MFRVVCCILALFVSFSVVDGHAVDRYRVDVRAKHYQHNPYSSTSTYDIDVSRTGLRKINPGLPVEARLADVPIGGRLSQTLNLHSQSKRNAAEANRLNAQAELARFQLQEAKKQNRQRKKTTAVRHDKRAIFLMFCDNDVEIANMAYKAFDGDVRPFLETVKAALRLNVHGNRTQVRQSLISKLGYSPTDASMAELTILIYQVKGMKLGEAVLRYLFFDCGLPLDQAGIALATLSD